MLESDDLLGNNRPKLPIFRASLVAHMVKNPPAMRESWVWPLGWEDPLEEGTATHSSILAWRIPWTIQSIGSQKVRHDWMTFIHTHAHKFSWALAPKQTTPVLFLYVPYCCQLPCLIKTLWDTETVLGIHNVKQLIFFLRWTTQELSKKIQIYDLNHYHSRSP